MAAEIVDKMSIGTTGVQYHVGVKEGDISDIVLMPGDPFRVQLIADRLENAVEVAILSVIDAGGTNVVVEPPPPMPPVPGIVVRVPGPGTCVQVSTPLLTCIEPATQTLWTMWSQH